MIGGISRWWRQSKLYIVLFALSGGRQKHDAIHQIGLEIERARQSSRQVQAGRDGKLSPALNQRNTASETATASSRLR
jgi:hypothetical protein